MANKRTARPTTSVKAKNASRGRAKSAKRNRPITKTKNQQKSRGNKLSKFQKAILVFGCVMLLAGGAILGKIILDQRSLAVTGPALQDNTLTKDNSPLISGVPVHITVPSTSIDINVIKGYYYPSTRSWTLSDFNAQWGVITAKPNNKQGDTFIYGHALMNVFGRLPKIQTGDEAVVTTDNGHKFVYRFSKSTVTSPADTSLFKYKGKPVLVLQTCSGLWYQNRQLFVFDFVKVS